MLDVAVVSVIMELIADIAALDAADILTAPLMETPDESIPGQNVSARGTGSNSESSWAIISPRTVAQQNESGKIAPAKRGSRIVTD